MKTFRELSEGDLVWTVRWDKYDARVVRVTKKTMVYFDDGGVEARFRFDQSYFERTHSLIIPTPYLDETELCTNFPEIHYGCTYLFTSGEPALKMLKEEETRRLDEAFDRYERAEDVINNPGSAPSKVRMYSTTLENTERRILSIEARYQGIYEKISY